jgi:hypothetical protein
MDAFTVCFLCLVGAFGAVMISALVHDIWVGSFLDCPPLRDKVHAMATTLTNPERTPIAHFGGAVLRVLLVFSVIGGVIGAGIGNVEGWKHLPWFYALYISIATFSAVVGVYWYANEH